MGQATSVTCLAILLCGLSACASHVAVGGHTITITDISPRLGPSSRLNFAWLGRDPYAQLHYASAAQTAAQGAITGRIVSIATNTAGSRVYAASFRGGVWRSDDAGELWTQLTGTQSGDRTACTDASLPGSDCSLPASAISQLTVSPANANGDVVFAATMSDSESPSRDGVYRSIDGGSQWTRVASFSCPMNSSVSAMDQADAYQVVFAAPDRTGASGVPGFVTGQRVWAVGGCQVAFSSDGGTSWSYSNFPTPMYHIAVAEEDAVPTYAAGPAPQRVYACSGNQVWISTDYASPSFQQDPQIGTLPPSACQRSEPDAGMTSNAIATVPGHPYAVYIAADGVADGLAYFFDSSKGPDGSLTQLCPSPCQGASLWYKEYNPSDPLRSAAGYRQVSSPPFYDGRWSTTFSGAVGVWTAFVPAGWVVLFMDHSSVSVLQEPTPTGASELVSWHRLDGPDASTIYNQYASLSATDEENKASMVANGHDGAYVHVDQHALTVTPSFLPVLSAPAVPAGAAGHAGDYFHNALLSGCHGAPAPSLFEGTDGGVFMSRDCGRTWQTGTNLSALGVEYMAGVARAGGPPSLYFGTFDNNAWYSTNGGDFWHGDVDPTCGDCQGYWSDPIAGIVSHLDADDFLVYDSTVHGPPDLLADVPLHVGYPPALGTYNSHTTDQQFTYFAAAWQQQEGWRPMVLTLPGESAPAADLVMVAPSSTPTASTTPRLYVYRYSRSTRDGAGSWVADGATLRGDASDATIVQAAGGHQNPTYYVGEQHNGITGAAGGEMGNRLFRSVRDARGNLTSWDCIWPGPADALHSGTCSTANTDRAWFFQSDPYDANVVYVLTDHGVMLSTNGGLPLADGSSSWRLDDSMTQWLSHFNRVTTPCIINCSASSAVEMLATMEFVPSEPGTRFAAGESGVFFTMDAASAQDQPPGTWHRLLDANAAPCMSKTLYFDPDSDVGRALYVGCDGRGVLRLSGIPTASEFRSQLSYSTTFVPSLATNGSLDVRNLRHSLPARFQGPDTLIVTPEWRAQTCKESATILPALEVQLQNQAGEKSIGWTSSPEVLVAGKEPWAKVVPAVGSVPKGKSASITIVPSRTLCRELSDGRPKAYNVTISQPGSNSFHFSDFVTPPRGVATKP